jgi:Putative transposase/Transposase zinc-binding domain
MAVHHHCAQPAPASAQPDRDRWEVADIVRLYGDTYRQTHWVSPTQQKVLEAIAACRTAQLGGHAEQCPQCGFERYAYNSCRNRHCPKCQTLTKEQWVEDRQRELLPVPYFHTVFTLPHELNPLVLSNKRLLLGLLFTAASQTLLQFGRQNLGGQLGGIMLLHTWDQILNAHFHVHSLVPGGALVNAGTCWVPTHPQFLFPVHALGTVFRAKFLEALRHPQTVEALCLPNDLAHLRTAGGLQALLDQLYTKAWIVYAKRSFAGPQQVVDYLGRYTHRVAISNHRLVDVRDGQVHFTFRNRRQGNRQQIMTLEAHEFLRRFLLHVVPAGFVRIRHYGFLANRCKARALGQCRQLLGQPFAPSAPEPKTVAQWMQQWTGIDITRCPQCGYGPLRRTPLPALATTMRTRAPPGGAHDDDPA